MRRTGRSIVYFTDFVKSGGGHPFLTDTNALYVGRRKNAIEHLAAAAENGERMGLGRQDYELRAL